MEKPRPSPNFGKFTSMRATPSSRSATAAGSSAGSRRITFASGDGALSVMTRRSLISIAIDLFLERLDTDAMHDVDEALGVAVAPLEIAPDQLFHHQGDVGAGERRPDHLAQCGFRSGTRLTLVSADLDLVPLLAVLIDAEDADVADMVVAAGVHAARDVEIELADVVQIIEIVEAPLDRLRHRDRLGVGERAEV